MSAADTRVLREIFSEVRGIFEILEGYTERVASQAQGREHEQFRTIRESLAAIREALADVTHHEGRS
jgi:hypothetical protein